MQRPGNKNNEASTVGGIAVYSGNGLGVNGDLNPKLTNKRVKKRKAMNKLGKSKDKTFTRLESKNMIESIIFDEYSTLIAEGCDPNDVLNLWDNAVKVIGLSFNYARAFMNDAIKLGDDETIKYNMKRAKAELGRISSLTQQLDKMLVKMYHAHQLQQRQANQNREELHPKESVLPVTEKAPPGREKQVKALKKVRGIDNPYAVAWASYNKSKGKTEASFDPGGEYQQFFMSAMEKHGIKNIDDLSDSEKKKFFNYIDRNYKAQDEACGKKH